MGQGGEGWEKGDKGLGLAMVCRHHLLASNTKLKQAGEALALTPGVGGASRLASALSWGREMMPNGLASSKINVKGVFLK